MCLLSYAVIFTITPACMNEIGRQYNASSATLAWLLRATMSGFFVAVLAAARYSDKHGKLRPLLFGCIAMSTGLLLFAWASTFKVAILAVTIAGIGGGSCEGTSAALLSDLYHGSKRTAMMNFSQAVFGLGAVSAPFAIAKLLQAGMHWQLGYIGAAVLSIVSAFVVFLTISLRVEVPVAKVETETGGWRPILHDRMVLWLTLGMLLYVAAEGGPASWLAVYFKKALHSSAPLSASSLSFFWFGILLGRVIAAYVSKYVSDLALIRVATMCAAVFQAILLLIHATIPAIIAAFALGVCLAPIWPTIVSLAGAAHPKQSGTVIGLVVASGALGAVIFPPIVGWLAVFVGIRYALWLCFVLLAAILLLFSTIRRLSGTDRIIA